ncbi:MAG: hypothetical protein U1E42_05705 [Rhodospirillales bacterium]
MRARLVLKGLAATYTLAGAAALVIGFAIRWDDPLAAVYPLLLGAPWTFLLSETGAYADDSPLINIALVTGAIGLNAALLWWWALRRRSPAAEPE